MWWEYLIIVGCLAAAVTYVLWTLARAFGGKCVGGSSLACRCGPATKETEDRGVKVVRLVHVRTPHE